MRMTRPVVLTAAVLTAALAAPGAAAAAGRPVKPSTTTTHHTTAEFQFEFPCVGGGNPYDVTTASDVTRTSIRPAGRNTTVIDFLDRGTYTATPSTAGGTGKEGRFYDAYRVTAVGAVLDDTGTVRTAQRYTLRRLLVLSDGGRLFFRDVITADIRGYDASDPADAPTDHVSCGS